MGDISMEPSMEEILSSIKRIIAEEGDVAVSARTRKGVRGATAMPRAARYDADRIDADEILELSDPVADALPEERPIPMGAPTPSVTPPPAEPIVSERAAEATRGPLEALSRIVVKPEVSGSDTLEGLVRAMLKPMLRDWLDANLPQMVESMVAREITRITGNNG
ncbi:DUF2497 domain-containing protein [Sphingomonas hengshuiensis]|uniref:DUF2497 domain-containing protein n=1 Tax=Sphingomonas hengshuiensis TaxID=1609977 RepID=A0A7U4J782_9SPHN|nr:DUF2497 domain-containing protein [Sphingomonas hengshuiensis]AJP71521.1 hypothetical protein TS85_06630 [Sphingomonas hengshuiensis]